MIGLECFIDWYYVIWCVMLVFCYLKVMLGYVVYYWGCGQCFGFVDIGEGNVYWWGICNMLVEQVKDWCGGKVGIQCFYVGWVDEVQVVIEVILEVDISSLLVQD